MRALSLIAIALVACSPLSGCTSNKDDASQNESASKAEEPVAVAGADEPETGGGTEAAVPPTLADGPPASPDENTVEPVDPADATLAPLAPDASDTDAVVSVVEALATIAEQHGECSAESEALIAFIEANESAIAERMPRAMQITGNPPRFQAASQRFSAAVECDRSKMALMAAMAMKPETGNADVALLEALHQAAFEIQRLQRAGYCSEDVRAQFEAVLGGEKLAAARAAADRLRALPPDQRQHVIGPTIAHLQLIGDIAFCPELLGRALDLEPRLDGVDRKLATALYARKAILGHIVTQARESCSAVIPALDALAGPIEQTAALFPVDLSDDAPIAVKRQAEDASTTWAFAQKKLTEKGCPEHIQAISARLGVLLPPPPPAE